MTVKELIQRLSKMPHDSKVGLISDGAVRSDVDHVWLSKSNQCVLCEHFGVVYYEEDRPAWAPSEEQCPGWEAVENNNV